MEAALMDVLEGLVAAQYTKGGARVAALTQANSRLQVVRHLARIAAELGLMTEKEHTYFVSNLIELGQQVGGWRKASDGTANSSSGSVTPAT